MMNKKKINAGQLAFLLNKVIGGALDQIEKEGYLLEKQEIYLGISTSFVSVILSIDDVSDDPVATLRTTCESIIKKAEYFYKVINESNDGQETV